MRAQTDAPYGPTTSVTHAHAAKDVSPEEDRTASVSCELDDVSATPKKVQQPTSSRIADPTRETLLLLGFFAVVPSVVGIASWLIAGPWTQHQCTSHIAQLSPPMLLDINNATYTQDPELSHHVTKGTISVELLMWTSLYLPVVVLSIVPALAYYLLYHYRKTKTTTGTSAKPAATTLLLFLMETAAAVSGFLTAWLLTLLATSLGKAMFHRPRPNFYSLCRMDFETLQCTSSSLHKICDAYFSLPSGHSSLSACAMVFVSCYIVGTMTVLRRRTTRNNGNGITKQQVLVVSLAIWMLLGSWAVYVAATRVHDHWHRVSDVSAGLALGTVTSLAVYFAYFGAHGPSSHQHHWYGCMAESPATSMDDDSGDVGPSVRVPDGASSNCIV